MLARRVMCHAGMVLWPCRRMLLYVAVAYLTVRAAASMTPVGFASTACLVITGWLTTWAVFSNHLDDTVLQRLGLSIVAIGTITRAIERLTNEVPDPPMIMLASQIGITTYAIGTAIKLWRKTQRPTRRRRGCVGA